MGKKILCADDDKNLMEALVSKFKSLGYTIIEAYDGEEALKKMQTEKPDLVIMDISMPKMNGYTLVTEMKSDEALKNIPVIVLSGRDSMQDIFEIEGVKNYFVKPFEFNDLLAKVKELLKEGR